MTDSVQPSRLPTRRLAQNTFWSLAGNALPAIAAILLVPFLITRLGEARFGLLALIWAGVGYFSLFDLGLSRGLTQKIAVQIARHETESIPALARGGLIALCTLGAVAAVLLTLLTPWLASTVVTAEPLLQGEARTSLWILACSLPFVLASAGLSGILEGYQRFRSLAYVRIPLGISNLAVPALLALFTPSLPLITVALVLCRLAMLAALFITCQPYFSGQNQSSTHAELRALFHFGGWLTVSNIVGPVLTYFDRFFISALVNLAAVAHYVTPHELISRMSILPQAIMSALFPALTQALASRSPGVAPLVSSASWITLLAMLPPVLAVVFFANELLTFWLNPEFAENSASVAKILSVGILVNTFARIPITALHGDGRADIAAKVHLSELLPYLLALAWLTSLHGVAGAAVAWLLRALADCLLLWSCAAIKFPALRRIGGYQAMLALATPPVCLLLGSIEQLMLKAAVLGTITSICVLLLASKGWALIRDKE